MKIKEFNFYGIKIVRSIDPDTEKMSFSIECDGKHAKFTPDYFSFNQLLMGPIFYALIKACLVSEERYTAIASGSMKGVEQSNDMRRRIEQLEEQVQRLSKNRTLQRSGFDRESVMSRYYKRIRIVRRDLAGDVVVYLKDWNWFKKPLKRMQ